MDGILIARPRLHFMQRGKNGVLEINYVATVSKIISLNTQFGGPS